MQSFTPMEYLMIDVASNFGLEKRSWNERIEWFKNNQQDFEPMLDRLAQGKPVKGTLMEKADQPAMFYAGLKAWQKASRGEAISYPISLDATASGAQIMAALVCCAKSASFCNLIDTGHREDFYTRAYESMCNRMDNNGTISRDMVKSALVPWFYGSNKEPKNVFGEGSQLRVFESTMEEETPGINALREALIELWNPEALSHDWVLPDNFHVSVKVMAPVITTVQFMETPIDVVTKENLPTDQGVSNAANIVHSIDGMMVREIGRRCSYDPYKLEALLELLTNPQRPRYQSAYKRPQDALVTTLWNHYLKSGFLSARILELLDEENLWMVDEEVIARLIKTLPEKPFKVLSVHDCFRVNPNYGDDLRLQYLQILIEIAASDLLSFIGNQITGGDEEAIKFNPDLPTMMINAEYALS
jgi:hypothetical protein